MGESPESLLANLHNRLERFSNQDDNDAVLSPDALEVVARLWDAVPDAGSDLEILQATGLLLWYRFVSPQGGQDKAELRHAAKLLAPVYRVQPDALPDSIRQYFDTATGDDLDSPEVLNERISQLLEEALTTDDTGALDMAIDLMEEALAAFPADHAERVAYLPTLGLALETRYAGTGNLDDLDRAIEVGEEAVAATPAEDPDRCMYQSNLGNTLRVRYERTGDVNDLDRAIEVGEQAVAATPTDDPDRGACLSNLGLALRVRFGRTGAVEDLDGAIENAERAVAATPADHSDRAAYLSNLGLALQTRFDRTGGVEDLERAIEVGEEAVAATPAEDPDRCMYQSNLGNTLRVRYERTGDVNDLDRAIEVGEQAVAATPTDDPDRGACLSNLGLALRVRFGRTGAVEDLDGAIENAERAVAATPADHSDRAAYLSNLGLALQTRFDRTGGVEDLERAIEVGEEAVAATPAEDPGRGAPLSNLGIALGMRFERTGALEDLDRSIGNGQLAVAATPADDPNRARYQSNLGVDLRARYGRTGDLGDLDQAVEVGELAVAATPADHPDRAVYLSNLGLALQLRYEVTGELDDANRGIEVREQEVAAAPADDPNRVTSLSNLGGALQIRYGRTGDVGDLDRAVEVGELAVAATPADHTERAACLSNLGNALLARYERTGDVEDLDRAVNLLEWAVEVTPVDHPDRALYMSNLGNILRTRYVRTGDLHDLDRAVEVGHQAVAATPAWHTERVKRLSNLGAALRTRYSRTGNLNDVNRAIEVEEQAVAAAPADHSERASYLSNLSNALQTRYEHTGNLDDVNRAIEVGEQAVAAAPADHPNRASYLSNLSTALQTHYERTGVRVDLDRSLAALREAAETMSAPALVRAQAAEGWGMLAVELGDWAEAVEGFTAATGLLGLVAPRGLDRADQEFRLGELVGMGSAGAAACLQAGEPGRAVELFEQGRGVLFAQMLDARTDLTDLAQTHPGLAEEFAHWRDELDRPDQPFDLSANEVEPTAKARMAADRRREAAEGFERVLGQIRDVPGFRHFLLPMPVAELLRAAAGGPVVLINVTEIRSDALILTPDGVEVLELPDVGPDEVAEHVNRFLDALDDAQNPGAETAVRIAAERCLSQILEWLWNQITGPVFDHLGFSAAPAEGEVWPRLWWCPSGPLALLPLHAAGHHDTRFDACPATVIDRVISSTIPTVRALLHARQATPLADAPRVLVVAMPHTPDQADLPGTEAEANVLAGLLPGGVDVVGLAATPQATHDIVTAALAKHAWAHFSCHGESDLDNPSASHLLLEDYRSQPLSVLDLTRLRLERVELAFLAACTTARGGAALPDEPIHLAGACQLAGYRHVIATMWPIGDDDAVRVTKRVYTSLATPNGPDAATAAIAVREATRQLRYLYPDWPSRWAAHTHAGP